MTEYILTAALIILRLELRMIPGPADPGCYVNNTGSAYNIILASGTYTSRTTGTIFRPSTRKGTISRQKKNSVRFPRGSVAFGGLCIPDALPSYV